MAAADTDRLFSLSDMQVLLSFAAGMGAFWLSGHLAIPSQSLPHGTLGGLIALALAVAVYGFVMLIWSWVWLGARRAWRPALIAAATVSALAALTPTILTAIGLSATRTSMQLALLVFGLYVIYGAYYVIGWFVAKKLAH